MSRLVAPDAPRLYSNGQPWRNARGRDAPRHAVETEFKAEHAVVDLSTQPPKPLVVQCLVRELRIRFYAVSTIKNYRSAWVCFLRWYRGPLDQIDQEDIREYLELLVNGGASASEVSVTLSALRTGLYTKVARMKATAVASPLDRLRDEPGSSSESSGRQPKPRPSVGRMRLEVDPNPDSNGAYAVTLGVWNDGQLLPLPGMRATMPRQDWVSLQIPLQDIWEPTLRCLPAAQRERLESPEFFSQLQREVAKRILRIRDAEPFQAIKT